MIYAPVAAQWASCLPLPLPVPLRLLRLLRLRLTTSFDSDPVTVLNPPSADVTLRQKTI